MRDEIAHAARAAHELETRSLAAQVAVDEIIASIDSCAAMENFNRVDAHRHAKGTTMFDSGAAQYTDAEVVTMAQSEYGDVCTHLMVLLVDRDGMKAGQFVATTRMDGLWGVENGIVREATPEEYEVHRRLSSVDAAGEDATKAFETRPAWARGLRTAARVHTGMVDPAGIGRK